jgi:uncharacterized protein (DUF885 family)
MTEPFELAAGMVDEIAAAEPLTATLIGVPGYDHLWDDLSPEGHARLADLHRRQRSIILPHLQHPDRWQRHAARVIVDYLDEKLDAFERSEYLFELRHTGGDLEDVRDIFDKMDTSTTAGWEQVIERMRTLAEPLEGCRQTLEEGRQKGLTVARRQVESNIEQAHHVAGPDSKWLRLVDKAGREDPVLAERLKAAVDLARRAVGHFAEYLEETYLPAAQEADGVGRERYIAEADHFLGLKIDPVETYQWGWTEVERITREMEEVAQQIDGNGLPAVIERLENDPEFAAPSQEAFVEFIQTLQNDALNQLDGVHFDVPGQIRAVTVNLVPPGGALGAYYIAPTEDFARAGGIWYSFGERHQIPLWAEVSTGYHEGFPGHHLQVGTAMAGARDLSRLHRLLVWYSGYGEGWALYTERLMDELGYFERPEYRLGMLASQQLRACRVVIDIGSHLGLRIPDRAPLGPGEPWTFAAGVEMLNQVAGLPIDVAESEVKRYLGWPGQAISYKVGERAILDLRQERRRREGSGFDLKEFHRDLLTLGEVRLDYLNELFAAPDRWDPSPDGRSPGPTG